jgi:tyrosyl-tRNA synthetase
VPREALSSGLTVVDLFTERARFIASKSEARKLMQQNGLAVNKVKVSDPKATVARESLINGRYLLLQKGKKDYCLVRFVG